MPRSLHETSRDSAARATDSRSDRTARARPDTGRDDATTDEGLGLLPTGETATDRAEVIDEEGEVFKFDDIGCMANFIKQKRNNATVQATFVMDFDRREWLKAESAFYVRSSELRTPMNGGIVAFKDQSGTEAAIAKYHGTKLEFPEVTK